MLPIALTFVSAVMVSLAVVSITETVKIVRGLPHGEYGTTDVAAGVLVTLVMVLAAVGTVATTIAEWAS